jgi:hypothetical protein
MELTTTYKPTPLLAHLHFLPTQKPDKKNAKEPSSNRTWTLQTLDRRATTERTPAPNSTLAIGGVSSPLDSFVVAESSVLRTNFCAEKPAHRQSANR